MEGMYQEGIDRSTVLTGIGTRHLPAESKGGGQQIEQADEYFQLSKGDFLRKKIKIIKQLV
jgi:hypothetical protein